MLDKAYLSHLPTSELRKMRDQIDAMIASREDTYEDNDDAPFPNPRPRPNPIPIGIDVAINDKVRLVEGISPKYLSGAVVQVTGFSGGGQPLARILTQKAGYKTFRLNPKYIAEVVSA